MDPERTYLRVHARLSGMLSQLLAPRTRMAVENACLAVSFALLSLLIVMHANFVQQPGCSSELSEINNTEAQLVQIKITGTSLWTWSPIKEDVVDFGKRTWSESSKIPAMDGGSFTALPTNFWSDWLGSSAKRSRLIFKSWMKDKQILETRVEKTPNDGVSKSMYNMDTKTDSGSLHVRRPISIKKLLKESVLHFCIKWNVPVIWFWNTGRELMKCDGQLWNHAGWCAFLDIMKRLPLPYLDNVKSRVRWIENKSNVFEPTYLYTIEKGYFLLPEEAKAQHNIRTINITISAQKSCFGNRWQRLLIKSFVGHDTILINSLLTFPGHGYLYNYQTKEFYDLNHVQDLSASARFGDYLVTKCGVLLVSLFVFFTTTMSVSFTLRETQARMLKFTVQLQHHARNQLPTFQLIFVHVVESLAFVPIMIGLLFFLFEFYDDQLLAFLVLSLVWLCELFTMISVRTAMSMQFFPRFILLYFLVFHLYFFSYPYGFFYLAFFTTAAFMVHLILYFWNRFEVPALQRFMRNQLHLQQQMGFQFASSAFYTSTLHIAGVNPNIVYNGTIPRTEGGSDPLGPRTGEVSDFNTLQTGTRPSSSLLNPFGSFLLWLLDGAPSGGIISFSSMFRDLRDQGRRVSDGQIQGGNVS